MTLGFTAAERQNLEHLLRQGLEGKYHGQIYAFGSRVRGNFRPSSDLDLWLDVVPSLSLETLGTLRRLLEESSLPFQVDLLDAQRVPSELSSAIRALSPQQKLLLLTLP